MPPAVEAWIFNHRTTKEVPLGICKQLSASGNVLDGIKGRLVSMLDQLTGTYQSYTPTFPQRLRDRGAVLLGDYISEGFLPGA